ncbi:MAG: glycosyltransferase family 9 protein, partial [Candidatus Omnitrophota bacterium]
MRYVYKKKIYAILFFLVDCVGGCFPAITARFSRKCAETPKSILVIRLDHIGDIVMATSVFAPLRRAFPEARIDLLAPLWANELLGADSNVDNIVLFDATWFSRKKTSFGAGLKAFFDVIRIIRNGKYDVAIDLRGDARHILAVFFAGVKCRISYGITGLGFLLTHKVSYGESLHEIDHNVALLEPLGIKNCNGKVSLPFSKESSLKAQNIKKNEGIDRPYAIFHTVSGQNEKNWTVEGFSGVIEHIAEAKGLIPVIIGSSEDSVYIERVMEIVSQKVINLAGKAGLGVLGPLCAGASLFVGLDSGPSHIAAASGVFTLILFSGI